MNAKSFDFTDPEFYKTAADFMKSAQDMFQPLEFGNMDAQSAWVSALFPGSAAFSPDAIFSSDPDSGDGKPPHFDHAFGFDGKLRDFAEAAKALADSTARLHALTSAAWLEAWQRFCTNPANLTSRSPDSQGLQSAMDDWLAFANEEMITFQRTDEFLSAQRAMVTALSAYRHSHREMVELFQEHNHMPTRTEVDDLSHSVYELKREVRRLKRKLERTQREAKEMA